MNTNMSHEPSADETQPTKPLPVSPIRWPNPRLQPSPTAPAPNGSAAGFLLLGLFLFLPGVLIAWTIGKDGHGWENGGRTAAWIGAWLSPFVWLAIIIVFTLLFTGTVTTIGCLLPGADCLAG